MSRTSALILLGILIILTPFSGFPTSIRSLLVVVFGACVSSVGLMIRAHEARGPLPPNEDHSSPSSDIPSI
jgi:hypothetical protein